MLSIEPSQLLEAVIAIAQEAGHAIMEYFGETQTKLQLEYKQDRSPLTAADLAANRIVVAGLKQLTAELPVLSEENEHQSYAERQQWSSYWLVDPLDGTRGFIRGFEEFTVNIALISEGKAVLGVIYIPVSQQTYYASIKTGAFKQQWRQAPQPISTSKMNWQVYRVALGRFFAKSPLLEIFQQQPGCEIVRYNSSLKFCLIAEGCVDIYPRLGPTGEWDSAAGQCIVEQAGGVVAQLSGQQLTYNSKESLINPPFVALGDSAQQQKIIHFIEKKRRNW